MPVRFTFSVYILSVDMALIFENTHNTQGRKKGRVKNATPGAVRQEG